jgi:AcrR family transcriptional regulator
VENDILIEESSSSEPKRAEPDVRLGRVASRSARRALASREAIHDDAVRRLVEASFALIRETGALEPRVAAIVARAGLSNQAFYRHFGSKDELLLCVLDEGFRLLADYLERRMAEARDPEAKIRAWFAGVLEQALDTDAASATRPFAVSRARLSELFPDEVEAAERDLVRPLRDAIAEAVARGLLPGADPDRDADTLHTLAMGWVQRKLSQRAPATRDEAEHLVAFALAGLRRWPEMGA